MPLTNRAIEALRHDPNGSPRQVHYDGKDVPGFGVRVYPSGRKTFVLQYRPAGSSGPRWLVLGPYGVLTLDQARTAAKKALHDARHGVDPIAVKRERKRGETVKDLAELFITREVAHYKTAVEAERRIRKHVIGTLGARRVKDVTTADVSKMFYAIGESAPVEANRIRTLLHRMYELARKWGFTDPQRINPVADVEPFKEKSRERFASVDEIPALWAAIGAEDAPVAVLFRLILLTGMRKNEALRLRWRDVNLSRATVTLIDTKAGEPQTVALSPQAVEVLRELPRGVGNAALFPLVDVKKSWGRIRARLWLAMNPDEAVRLRRQAEADVRAYPKHSGRGKPAVEARLLTLALEHAKAGDERLTIHDLRRTAGSLMALHEAPTTIGKALRNPSAVATYTRISDSEARRALVDHGARLEAIVTGKRPR